MSGKVDKWWWNNSMLIMTVEKMQKLNQPRHNPAIATLRRQVNAKESRFPEDYNHVCFATRSKKTQKEKIQTLLFFFYLVW